MKLVNVGLQSICTPFYIQRVKTAFSELVTDTYATKVQHVALWRSLASD